MRNIGIQGKEPKVDRKELEMEGVGLKKVVKNPRAPHA